MAARLSAMHRRQCHARAPTSAGGHADNLVDVLEVLRLEDEGADDRDPVGLGREADNEVSRLAGRALLHHALRGRHGHARRRVRSEGHAEGRKVAQLVEHRDVEDPRGVWRGEELELLGHLVRGRHLHLAPVLAVEALRGAHALHDDFRPHGVDGPSHILAVARGCVVCDLPVKVGLGFHNGVCGTLEVLLVLPVLELLAEHGALRIALVLLEGIRVAGAHLAAPVVLLLHVARAHRALDDVLFASNGRVGGALDCIAQAARADDIGTVVLVVERHLAVADSTTATVPAVKINVLAEV
mmetsp:Transcript_20691/g.61157  ORF Transcript_20691/g.61157 Transcript_20691/m.61157 type:complete len:298 (+) Transcript_20691:351-1244(+)